MNRNGLWIVIVVTAGWIGFLLGYAVSSHTGAKPPSGEQSATGGYGKPPGKAATGGYGAQPGKAAAGGYGR